MPQLLDVVLLLALPASGKSEIRRYLGSLTPEQSRNDMHLGQTVDLDDYPYVHLMRRISQESIKAGSDGVFFDSQDLPMKQPLDWGTLIELLNEDFDDLVHRRRPAPASAAAWLFDRFDAARVKVGAQPALGRLPKDVRTRMAEALEAECRELLQNKNDGIADSLAGRTVVIEFARGGPDGVTPPLAVPMGYAYSLSRLSDAILSRATIFYVWVTPEESRRRNIARTDPNDPGSILHHGVPGAVMLGDYGTDDMSWLMTKSDRPDTVRVDARGAVHHLPAVRFDNREDKTSFVRADRSAWSAQNIQTLHAGLSEGFGRLVNARESGKLRL
jgi:hypothetical protein